MTADDEHRLNLAYANRLAVIEYWLRTLLNTVDDHAEDVPRPIHRVAGFARKALDAPMRGAE